MHSELTGVLDELAGCLTAKGARLATAESCTGGMIASRITDKAGSSAWFEGAVVSYSNAMKKQLLGVSPFTLQSHGAVSQSCAEQMAAGVRRLCGCEYSIATTGIAGPGGGSDDKPVGTVWLAWQGPDFTRSERILLAGNRDTVRVETTFYALNVLLKLIKSK
ncbi:damage-inducible protein CinA [Aliidiomarina sedimenti]|uniref:Damage-inducible protein CinA n=1 Tax=Aliidiomarina sedimenti TaxID=1933879 RepID=A0ABY0C2Y9_9GAMM|nr:CinA family protein [Aliidiomarina sedimenti]RUO31952.1 damage-inducible protein CinA [Aliidiomarina sedimenti]